MLMYEIIKKKREGFSLNENEMEFVIKGFTDGKIPDYQMSALLMAIFFRGFSMPELSVWTRAMLFSGEIIDLSSIKTPKIDKHSTGGVGDKVSLALAPLVAACGVIVPMISGRSLGHTGGTLDKLESIPGFRVFLSQKEMLRLLVKHGFFFGGQTETIVPADKKIYALRDATGTVESKPLIASSIMSKKLAESIDGLVLDIKVGSGAFIKTLSEAKELAQLMTHIGNAMGVKISGIYSNMNEPLGQTIGNSLEAIEAFEILHGRGPEDVKKIIIELGGLMLSSAGLCTTLEQGKNIIMQAIESKKGLEKMANIIQEQGGNPDVLKDYSLMPTAKYARDILAPHSGIITRIQCEKIGMLSVLLGAGRRTKEDAVDPAVGFTMHKKIGDAVFSSEPIITIHYNSEEHLDTISSEIIQCFTIENKDSILRQKLILETFAPLAV